MLSHLFKSFGGWMAIRLFTCPLHGRWFILVFIEMKIDCVSHIYGRSVILKYTLGAGDEHKLELPMLCFQCSINNLDAFWKMTQHFVAVVCVCMCAWCCHSHECIQQNNCQCQYQLWKCQKFIELHENCGQLIGFITRTLVEMSALHNTHAHHSIPHH